MGDPRGQVQIYELRTFKPVQQFKAHAAGLLGLKLLSTAEKFGIYTFGRDRGVLVYDIKQGEPIQRYEKDAVSFSALAVEEEGNVIAAAGFDGNIHVWFTEGQEYLGSIPSNDCVVSLDSHPADHVSRDVQFHPEERKHKKGDGCGRN